MLNKQNLNCLQTYQCLRLYKPYWLVVYSIFFSAYCYSQIDTTLHHLQDVNIIETKQEVLQSSKKNIRIDSITMSRYSTNTLSDLLLGQSGIHIKSYGNGNIATTSLRGGNANHTALLWNGLNIQNPLLGQTDLNSIPTFLFDDVSIEYGGGSAIWGSGAIGGSIHINNKISFNTGFKTKLSISMGSFETKKIAATTILSYKKIVSTTRLYYNSSENNYSYKDTLDKEHPNKNISHANYVTKGLMQELSFLVTPFQKIDVRLWYNSIFRNLPSYTSSISKQSQEDKNLKLNANWNYSKNRINSTIRLAYFNDVINYVDSMIPTVSNSYVKTFIAESDNLYSIKHHKINFGINYTSYNAQTENYYNTKHLNKTALFAAYKVNLFKSKLNYNISIRKEFTNQTLIPVTGNTGIHYQIIKWMVLKINASKAYRQPTLNDLYWNPGGNSSLKPEESKDVEAGIDFKVAKKRFTVLIEATYFNRHTNNWIIWLPTNYVYWSPKNIAEVYSRGTETKTELIYTHKKIQLKLLVNTSYVLSTSQKAISENDNSLGRQLIYTPRYTGNASLSLSYKNLNILLNQSYTGYRFTSTDNSAWLNPYNLTTIKGSYHHLFNNTNIELFGSINNVLNKNYMVISNRPMPLRNFEAGIVLQYIKKKTTYNN